MKKIYILLLFVLSVAVFSCNKADYVTEGDKEIVIGFDNSDEFVVDTKATAITTLPSTLYWGGTTGGNAAGTSAETSKWATASATVSSSQISTGKYQTLTPTSYTYYVANQTFTVAGNMTVANNNTDVIAGRTAAQTTATPSVTLNHIFARTGTFTCNTQSGYTISNVSFQIIGKSDINGTAGTYNMKSQSWTAATTKLSSYTGITSSSDMYLIPGTYTIKVSYTLTLGDYTNSFTKTADVTFVGNKVNNVTVTAIGGSASQIVISLGLTAWSNQAVAGTLS